MRMNHILDKRMQDGLPSYDTFDVTVTASPA